ncbi:MAG: hypothetical protein COA99_17455 [Moraxellaceae bacterium]|nr:MAG: hypothetical protein COA99_17455 [Moraxellaceae bacterium]
MRFLNVLSTLTVNRAIYFFLLLLIPALSPFILDIEYRSDIEDYFRPGEKSLLDYQELKDKFAKNDTLLLVVSLDSVNNDMLINHTNLTNLSTVFHSIESLTYIKQISSLLDSTVTLETIDGQQNITLGDSVDPKRAISTETGQALHSQAINNLSGKSFWLAENGLSTVAELTFAADINPQQAYDELVQTINEINLETYRLRIKPWGNLAVKASLHHALIHDGIYLFPLIVLAGALLLYCFMGSITLVISGVLTILAALAITIELTGLMGATINQTSVLAFGIVFIISLADVIHVLMCYQAQEKHGEPIDIHGAIKKKLLPLCLTSLTTCIGFLCLDVAGSPTFSTFGFVAATGVTLALITTIYILPPTVELIHRPNTAPDARALHEGAATQLLYKLIDYFSAQVNQNKSKPLIILLTLSLFVCYGLFRNTFHNDSLAYFSDSTDISKATAQFEQDFGTHQGIAIMLNLPSPESIYDPIIINAIDDFHHWLDQQYWASIHASYATALINIHRGLHENDFRWQRISNDPQQIGELFSLYEMASSKNTLEKLGINKYTGTVLVSVGIPEILNKEAFIIQHDIETWFATNAPFIKITVSGQGILFANVGWNLTKDMLMGAGLTLTIITLIIGLVYRSARYALVSLIPNILPALLCLGAVGWLSGKINFAIASSVSMALGIVVDDTIHVLSEYRRLRLAHIPPRQAITNTMVESGPALLLTTLVLSVGFSILLLAVFLPNIDVAQMITGMVVSAILYDFILLPYILVTFDRWIFPQLQTKTDHQKKLVEQG